MQSLYNRPLAFEELIAFISFKDYILLLCECQDCTSALCIVRRAVTGGFWAVEFKLPKE